MLKKPRSKETPKIDKQKPQPSAVKEPDDIFGCLKGEIEIVGDLLSPAIPPEDWEALRES